jgi:HEAT repeat protein
VAALVKRLKDEDVGVQWKAAETLGLIGPAAEPAVPVLAELLKDTRLRTVSAEALGRIGPKAQAAVSDLVNALKDKDERFRWSAVGALVRIRGPGAKAVVPLLIQELGSGEHRNYYNATLYLSALGPEAKDAIPELRKRKDDLAACALWSIDPKNGIQGYILTSLTTDRTCDQWFAASHFQMMGPWRKEAARAVAEALLDGRLPKLAPWAVERILRGEAEAVVPALLDGLKDKQPTRKVRAAKVLGDMGPSADAAVPALNDALKDSEATVREAAAIALKQVMPKK